MRSGAEGIRLSGLGLFGGVPGAAKGDRHARGAGRLAGDSLLVASNTGLDDFEVFALQPPTAGQSIDEFTDAAAPVVAKSLGDEVGSTTYVATVQLTNQAMGREVEITKNGRPVFAMRVYQAGGRYYQVIARGPLGPTDPAFLDSFKIIPAAPPLAGNAAG